MLVETKNSLSVSTAKLLLFFCKSITSSSLGSTTWGGHYFSVGFIYCWQGSFSNVFLYVIEVVLFNVLHREKKRKKFRLPDILELSLDFG